MVTNNQINKALDRLGLSNCYVGGTGFGGISIDSINECGNLDTRHYYFNSDEEFEDFILNIVGDE